MWGYTSLAYVPLSVQCHLDAVQYFSAGLDQSSQAWNRSIKEKKGDTKNLENMLLKRGQVCDTSQNDGVCVCGFSTISVLTADKIPLTKLLGFWA